MAETIFRKNERKKKLNFSSSEINKITKLMEENLEIIQSKFTNAITNKRKQEIWVKIAGQVNAIGIARRSVQDIEDKWKNLQTTAKKDFARQSFRQTGGGPPVKKTKEATEKFIRLFKNAPSFTGLNSFETSGRLKWNSRASLGRFCYHNQSPNFTLSSRAQQKEIILYEHGFSFVLDNIIILQRRDIFGAL